ncbi:hypothetical protein BW75_01900 [Escherichia coli O81:NM str. 02-3012]|jgi:hypothetical protein|nr:hypothetical protein BW75_01900 [Escherichia coli O81:NM str. 02-3012]
MIIITTHPQKSQDKKCTKAHEIAQFFLCVSSPFSPVTALAEAGLHGARKTRQLQCAGDEGRAPELRGGRQVALFGVVLRVIRQQ